MRPMKKKLNSVIIRAEGQLKQVRVLGMRLELHSNVCAHTHTRAHDYMRSVGFFFYRELHPHMSTLDTTVGKG